MRSRSARLGEIRPPLRQENREADATCQVITMKSPDTTVLGMVMVRSPVTSDAPAPARCSIGMILPGQRRYEVYGV
ncbi:hypothetical protein BJF79_03585 [Actinomadura sp. CNU-125]|nr:hypothetical protein BJF79_03585 [Actinomadura sp. CNU-125]